MQINIKATNAKLTPAAHEIITEKMTGLGKYFSNIITVDVEIGISTLHHSKGDIYKAVVNVAVPKKILRASAETDDISKSISAVKEKLKQELIKYKETRQ